MSNLVLSYSTTLLLLINSLWTNDIKEVSMAGSVNWVSIEEAQEFVKENPRKVFIDVYADWCGWCKVMDRKTFTNNKVAEYINENYYAVKLNAESKKTITFNGKQLTERELAQSFKVQGLPTIVFIDEYFKKVKPVPGYQNAQQFLNSLEKFNR